MKYKINFYLKIIITFFILFMIFFVNNSCFATDYKNEDPNYISNTDEDVYKYRLEHKDVKSNLKFKVKTFNSSYNVKDVVTYVYNQTVKYGSDSYPNGIWIDVSSFNIPESDADEVVVNNIYIDPQLFYVEKYGKYCENGILEYVGITYYMTNSEIQETQKQIDAKTEEYLTGIRTEWNDMEKAIYTNNYLCALDEYNYEHVYDNPPYWPAHRLNGALIDGLPVCEGYAKAYKYLLEKVGVDSILVTNSDHMWNLVKINGKYYNVDVTWNDGNSFGYSNYLFCSDSDFQSTTNHYQTHSDYTPSGYATSTIFDGLDWKDFNSSCLIYHSNKWYYDAEDSYNSFVLKNVNIRDYSNTINTVKTINASSAYCYHDIFGDCKYLYYTADAGIYRVSYDGIAIDQLMAFSGSTENIYLIGANIINNKLNYYNYDISSREITKYNYSNYTWQHDWNTDYTIDNEATCIKNGQKSIHCKECDELKEGSSVEIPIDTTKHNWSTDYIVDNEATCIKEGQKSIHCLDCNSIDEDSIVNIPIDSDNHTWNDDYTVDKEATFTENGQKSIHCKNCKIIKDDSIIIIPKLDLYNSSVTKKVISSNNLITLGNGKEESLINEFLNLSLQSLYTFKLYNLNNELVSDSTIVGSKYIVKFYDLSNNLLETSLIVVKGDVSGDGVVAIYDAFQILKGALSNNENNDIDTYIRDYNEDGKVAIYDAFQYLKQALK